MSESLSETNKALVLEAFDAAFNRKDPDALERYWAADYIQHSAHIGPGRAGLQAIIDAAPREMRYENQLIVAHGEYVMLHGRFSNIGVPVNWVVVDIVRVADGRLAEHLDVIQDEATEAQSKSGMPMFGERFPA